MYNDSVFPKYKTFLELMIFICSIIKGNLAIVPGVCALPLRFGNRHDRVTMVRLGVNGEIKLNYRQKKTLLNSSEQHDHEKKNVILSKYNLNLCNF